MFYINKKEMFMEVKKASFKTILKFAILLLILLSIVVFAFNFAPWIAQKAKNPEAAREYLRSFGGWGFLIYVLIQAAHVLIVVIPGDIFSVCGGYIYGIPIGFLLSFTGIMLGTVVAFYISRIFGYDFIRKFISEEKISKISGVLNSTKGTLSMLVICLIPIIPKDLMMYVAGLTPVKASRLFFVYALSRIPGTIVWVSVGAQAHEKNVMGIIITLSALVVLGSAGFLLQKYLKKKII